jgi:hypothetical protein
MMKCVVGGVGDPRFNVKEGSKETSAVPVAMTENYRFKDVTPCCLVAGYQR